MLRLAVDRPLAELTEGDRRLLLDRRPVDEEELRDRVREIVAEVRRDGDTALLRMARELDGVELPALEVPPERWTEALEAEDPAVRRALHRAARNLSRFHEAQIPDDLEIEVEDGLRLGRRTVPLAAAGVYAPGGRAAYPSSVLMGAVSARAAGVGEVVVCSPPGPEGEPPPGVLAACEVARVDRLFAVGGAGAIAAMAYGTATVPAVDVVVGPGNRWVTEGKRQVAGQVRTDGPAGPSEVLVVAQGERSAEALAGELVAQAEHDPEAAVALVTPDRDLLARTRTALERQVEASPRREIVEEALAFRGALLGAPDLPAALDFAEAYAPEHLLLATDDPHRDLEWVTTAGTVFVGEATSVAFGDYLTGANHVLPTGGRARAFSGLGTHDFLRSYTWQEADPTSAASLSADTAVLAETEGLPGHAAAARMRAPAGTDASTDPEGDPADADPEGDPADPEPGEVP